MTKYIMIQGDNEEIFESSYKSMGKIEIQIINSDILKFSIDYRELALGCFYFTILIYGFLFLVEWGGIYNGVATIHESIIFNSIFGVIMFVIWFYYKFNVVEFVFNKRENIFSKDSVFFGVKRHFECKLEDIHYIECEKSNSDPWRGSAIPYKISLYLIHIKKISFYDTADKEEAVDYSEELRDFLDVKVEYARHDSNKSWI